MAKTTQTRVEIPAPNLKRVVFHIVGTAPYVQNRFSAKAEQQILAKHLDPTLRGKRKREAKVPEELFEGAQHRDADNRCGIPASAFRAALISACRLVGYQMTRAKLSVFVPAETYDVIDGTPLVRIEGEPEMVRHSVRNETGVVDIRFRPMWRTWAAKVPIVFDADQFTVADVLNLLMRVGAQVGIGEGRADSKNSTGMGWGTFDVVTQQEVA